MAVPAIFNLQVIPIQFCNPAINDITTYCVARHTNSISNKLPNPAFKGYITFDKDYQSAKNEPIKHGHAPTK
jgi:hypothetical protein